MRQVVDEIIETTLQNYKGRRILIWGYKSYLANIIEAVLKDKGIDIFGRIDSNKVFSKLDNVYTPDILCESSLNYYVVIPLGRYKSIINCLRENKYERDIDYSYFCDCAISEEEYYYEDAHGNRIIGYSENAEFVFLGYDDLVEIGKGGNIAGKITMNSNSHITIGNGTTFEANLIVGNDVQITVGNDGDIYNSKQIIARDNSKIIIGDGFEYNDGGLFKCDEGAEVTIGDNVIIRSDSYISTQKNSKILIGDGCDIGTEFRCLAPYETSLKIGNECLISWGVSIISHDAHLIFNVETGDCINKAKKNVDIGEHVWIGNNCTVLPTTSIGGGTVIGAGSIVKGSFPNNCILAGQPARVVRRDVAWSKYYAETIEDIPDKYVNKTE